MSNFCLQDVENKDKSFDVVKFGNNFSRPGKILILASIFQSVRGNAIELMSRVQSQIALLYYT